MKLCTDFDNLIFEKKITEPLPRSLRWRAHFRGRWGQILDFICFFTSFRLEFLSFWGSRLFALSDLGDLRRGSVIFFLKLHLWTQCTPRKKMRHVFPVKIFTKSVHRGGVSAYVSNSFCWITHWFQTGEKQISFFETFAKAAAEKKEG